MTFAPAIRAFHRTRASNSPGRMRPQRRSTSMKVLAANSLAIFGLSLLLCAPLRAAADLLAHANDQTLWIAQVRSVRTLDTTVRYRALGGELQWRELPKLTGRAVDLASRGSSLAV